MRSIGKNEKENIDMSKKESKSKNYKDVKISNEQLMIMYNIVNKASLFISYNNPDGECLFINHGAELLTGYTHVELKTDPMGLIFGNNARKYNDAIIRGIRRNGTYKFRYKGKHKNGSIKTFEVVSDLMEKDHFSTRMFDITDLVNLQETTENTNKRLQLMLDSSPFCAQVWDKDLSTVDCNEAGLKLYGFDNKYEYISNFIEHCSPEFQPDGQRSSLKAVRLVNKAFQEGLCVFDWMHKMPYEDTLIPAEISLVKVNLIEEDIVIGYTIDRRDQVKSINELNYQRNLLESVNKSAVILFSIEKIENVDHAIKSCLDLIGTSLNVERISIWRVGNNDGETTFSKRFQWLNKDEVNYLESSSENLTPFTAVPEWKEKFFKGETTHGIVSKMPTKERKFFNSYGIKSALALPIFLDSEPWGLLLIDNYKIEHDFTYDEIESLKTFVFLLASRLKTL